MSHKDNNNFDIDSLCCRTFDQNETIQLLQHPNPFVFWSWGVERRLKYKDIGLLLYVNARRHTGWILISLSYKDLFDVHLFEPGQKKIKKSIKDLYFDQLKETIDNEIEKIDNYEF